MAKNTKQDILNKINNIHIFLEELNLSKLVAKIKKTLVNDINTTSIHVIYTDDYKIIIGEYEATIKNDQLLKNNEAILIKTGHINKDNKKMNLFVLISPVECNDFFRSIK